MLEITREDMPLGAVAARLVDMSETLGRAATFRNPG
jgi:hypothetical protein